jgi:hypothetical protein
MVFVVLLAFWLPGLLLGGALRLRSWTLAAAAPVLTFSTIALGTVVLGRLGIRWNLLSVATWAVVLTAVVGLASWLAHRWSTKRAAAADTEADELAKADHPLSLREHLTVGVGVALGMAVGVITFLRGIGSLDNINQDWDAPFHANAVRWIAEHGGSLPSDLAPIANFTGAPGTFFYPNTYHALLAPLLGSGLVELPQLLNLAVLAVVIAWPLGIAALGLAWRMPPLAAAVAAAVSTWFTAFPYDSLWRGPLWPYVAAVALLPATFAIARHIIVPRGLAGPVGTALAIGGLVALHTSLVFVVAGYAVPLLLAMVLRLEPVRWRSALLSLGSMAVVALLIALPLVLPALNPSGSVTAAQWPEFASPAEGFGQVLTFSPVIRFPQWFLGIAAVTGVVLLVRHRRLVWVAAGYLVFGALYALCASVDSAFVNFVTGPFYNDAWRFAALLPLAGALGVGELAWTVTGRVSARLEPRVSARIGAAWLAAATAVVMLGALAVLGKGAYVGRNADRLAAKYHNGPTVSSDERAAYKWLAEHSGDHPVMNDKLDGSVWMYAIAGVHPVDWTLYGYLPETKQGLLTNSLNQLDRDPEVRKALNDLRVRYVLVGNGMVREDSPRAGGFQGIETVAGLHRVFSNKDATVYEVLPPGTPKP